jgi:hypothetical protein
VDVIVANVGNDLFDSQVHVDFVEEVKSNGDVWTEALMECAMLTQDVPLGDWLVVSTPAITLIVCTAHTSLRSYKIIYVLLQHNLVSLLLLSRP